MVYSNFIDNSINDSFNMMGLNPNTKSVKIVYNGSGIHTITGPVPYITMGRKTATNDSGYLNSIPVSINLNGKIVRNGTDTGLNPPGTGTQSIFGAIQNLKNLFIGDNSDNYNGVLKILCGGNTPTDGTEIFSATGVRLVNFTADKTSDNWITTADYSIDLEFYENKPQNNGFFIKSSNDSWSIEPIEDYIYTNTSYPITQNGEYHNPKLSPTPPSINNPVPSQGLGPGIFSQQTIDIKTIPRFKITRQLSAVGVPVGTGNTSTNSAYKEAKRWVENRLSQSFNNAESGVAYFFQQSSIPINFSYLYNHLRTTNFNINAGSYDVTETWLAMPTGLKFIEDYSIDTSTDDKFIKTVRVQGEIQGLSLVDLSVMSGGQSYLNTSSNASQINLSGSTLYTQQTSNHQLADTNFNSRVNTFSQNKYDNAYNGWINDVKPYLYRRASLVMNSADRDRAYIDPTKSSAVTLNNPAYSFENLLNVIPVSTTEGHNPRKGSISYNYEFNNRFNYISGVISSNISINDVNPADVIGEAFVLGRRLGPVLQDLGAKTATKKDITIEVNVMPPASIGGFLLTNTECPLYTGGLVYTTINSIVEGLKPYGDRPSSIFGNYDTRTSNQGTVFKTSDTQSWNPVDGRYSRSVGWTYQPCTNLRNNLDN